MKKTERGWAIAGPFGLYVGWHMTRAAAIRDHIASKVCVGGKGDPRKRIWEQCKKDGDRAVRVEITYSAR